jgi:hypothetical protein
MEGWCAGRVCLGMYGERNATRKRRNATRKGVSSDDFVDFEALRVAFWSLRVASVVPEWFVKACSSSRVDQSGGRTPGSQVSDGAARSQRTNRTTRTP